MPTELSPDLRLPEDWGAELRRMESEWRSVRPALGVHERATDAQATVRRWRTELEALERMVARLREEERWFHGRPDFLGVLGRGRRELYHSQMLCWMLDPGTPSGLGVDFLRAFLREINAGVDDLDDGTLFRTEVDTEVAGPEARTDILIRGEGFTVAIEVKVDAGEGHDQCGRIYRDYKTAPGVRFVFLTPTGREPEKSDYPDKDQAEKVANAFRAMGFPRVRDLLWKTLLDDPRQPARLERLATHPRDPWSAGVATCLSYLATLEREFK